MFIKKLAGNIKKDPKSCFVYTRSKTTTKNSVGPFVDNEGNVITDTSETANVLNDFFTSVFPDEDVDDLLEQAKVFKNNMEEALLQVKFTPDVVMKKLTHLKPIKAPGVDNLNSTTLREVAPAIAYPLSEIVTESLAKGKYRNIGSVPT